MTEDDDWPDDEPTRLDEPILPESDTAPHRAIDYLGGRETGYTEGLNAILADLAAELRRIPCLTETNVLVIVGRLREKAERKG